MNWISTRNPAVRYSLAEAVARGLAPDGGLFLPERIPELPLDFFQSLHGRSLADIGKTIAPLFFDEMETQELANIVADAYPFDTPLVRLDDDLSVLELFHGPTFAFKDVGARFLARLLGRFAKQDDRQITVLVATSGDTGSAVASGFAGIEGVHVVILYPLGKVSDAQEAQLTTAGDTVTALAVEGTFDDCQRLAKAAFLDPELTERLRLTSANSIHIARLIPQTFYYFRALAQLSDLQRPVVMSVPSGNLGNLTAGVIAKRMGLPISRFIAATNQNDVFPNYIASGTFTSRPSVRSASNAMDVGNPSNLERLQVLYDHNLSRMRQDIQGVSISEDQTRAAIKEVYERYGYVLDPHGAVGYAARDRETSTILLATAHPAKFPDVVEQAIGRPIPPHPILEACIKKERRRTIVPPEFDVLKNLLTSF